MFCVEFRDEKPGLFGGCCHKQVRAFRRRIYFCKRCCELDKRGDTGRVIDCAIKNLIALQFGITPEMVPVRCVDDVFILQFRIAPVEFADDVVRFKCAKLLFDVDVVFGIQCHRPELFCDRRLLQRVHVFVWRIYLIILFGPACFHD